MKKLHHLFLFFLWGFLPLTLHAQIVEPPNNDCINVFLAHRLLCGNAVFTTDNLNGYGINDFGPQNQNNSGCLLNSVTGVPEAQSAWYAFKIQTSGTLTLDILPLANDDYDFAIFGPNKPCNKLTYPEGKPLRCSYASPKPPNGIKTGLSLTTGEDTEPAGGDGYVKYMDVVAGELYYMLINNWSNNSSGFLLNWGGTGKIAISTSEFTVGVSCNIATFTNNSLACDISELGYEWDFGDGSPITSENFKRSPRHNYEAVGTYVVKLKTIITSSPAPENVGVEAISQKTVVITKVPPVIQLPNLQSKYCVTDAPVTLTATPTGGKFAFKQNQTGDFVDNLAALFNPATLGPGKHEVRYTYQDPTDIACASVKLVVVTVSALPTLALPTLADSYCIGSPTFALTATPAGGVFKINNTVATNFDVTALGVGTHTVKYDYTDVATNCSNSISKQVTVNPIPVLAFPNLRDAYCLAGSPFVVQATPTGGTMSINGVATNNFNIPTLGIGNHTVVYNYTSPEGCSNQITKQVQIAEKPVITFGLDNEYCIGAYPFNLQATPSGGIFKVNGVTATQFDPSVLGAGSYTIEYNYIDPNDATCFNSATKIVEIKKAPVVVISGVSERYCISHNTTVNPQVHVTYSDGTIQIENPASISFLPQLLPVGNHVISYSVADPITGCITTVVKTIAINTLPVLNFVDLLDSYCQQSFIVPLKANISGGTFTIDGVPATQLDPKTFAVGDRPLVKYDYTDANTCSNSISKQVEITTADAFTPVTEDLKICPQPQYMLEALTLAQETDYKAQGITPVYYWEHTTGSLRRIPITEKGQEGLYSVTVRDQSGCPIAQKTFDLKVDCEPKLFVPTAFTPNGDANNPFLKIYGGDFTKLDFKVYNRWGEVVFTARKIEEVWDGTIKGKPAPEGVYAWTATFENSLKKGEVMRKQGQFVLIR